MKKLLLIVLVAFAACTKETSKECGIVTDAGIDFVVVSHQRITLQNITADGPGRPGELNLNLTLRYKVGDRFCP